MQAKGPDYALIIQSSKKRADKNAYKKNLVLALLLVSFIIASIIGIIPNANASPGTINVPTDYSTIQAAIDAASPGDTIIIQTGAYTEGPQILINKNLTITGTEASTTIIKPAGDTGSSGDSRGWFLVNPGVALSLSNLTLDGTGHYIYQAIRHKGEGTVKNCIFENITYPSYQGFAIVAFGGDVDVVDCQFLNIGRVGVLYYGVGVTDSLFSGNSYAGKDDGDWLDYGVEVGAGAHVFISRNVISGCTGVASVDNSSSAGILVTTYYGAGSLATIVNNTISNCTYGIAVGYDEADTSSVVAQMNNLYSNDWGIGSTAPTVNAPLNWWGDASGPTHSGNPGGIGDAVSDYVDYTPWLDEEYTLTINVTYPTQGAYLGGVPVIWINGTMTETNWTGQYPHINDTSFNLDSASWNGTHFAFYNTTAIADGKYSYIINFTDLADNTASDTATFTIDTVPPAVDITYPTNGTYLDSVETIWINGTITELNMGTLEPAINDTGFDMFYWNSATGAFAFKNNSVMLDQTHFYTINFTDPAGNTGYDIVYFTIDTTNPNVEITTPTDNHYFDSEAVIWINGTFVEKNINTTVLPSTNDTRFELTSWTWNETTYDGAFAFWNTSALLDSAYYIKVSITDLAGKIGFDTVYFTIDTIPPVVDIVSPKNGQYLNTTTIWINGTIVELNKGSLEPHINNTAFSLVSWNSLIGTYAFQNNTALSDSTISTMVNFTDLAGKMGSDTAYFVLDTTSPVITITYPTEGTYLNVPSLWINGTVTEINVGALEPSINDTRFILVNWNSTTGEFTFKNNTVISDGLISLLVNFTDLAGNTGSDSVTFTLAIAAPVVAITYPTDGAYVSVSPDLWINGTVAEPNKNGLLPSINDTRFQRIYWENTTGIFGFKNSTAITDGPISVSVNFTNMAGSTGVDTVFFILDNTIPKVNITSPLESSYVSAASYLWINGTVTELNMGSLEPYINDSRFNLTYWNSDTGVFDFRNNTAVPDGPVSIMINFTDLAGNTGKGSVSFVLDSTAPTKPTEFAVTVVEGNATFTWTASTDNSAVKGYYLELNSEIHNVGNVTNYTRSSLNAEAYTARLWSTDIVDNNSTDAILVFTVTQKADIIEVSCPTGVYKGQWFLLNVTVQNVGNLTDMIFVNVSDTTGVLANKTMTLTSNSTAIVTFSLTAPTSLGSRTLNITAGHGFIIDDFWMVTIEVLNRAPVASFDYSPEFPIAGENVTFNASASYDLDGMITIYKWNFSDGTPVETSPKSIITHAYNAEGNYTVTLTAVDNDGSENSTFKAITIVNYPTANFTYLPIYPIAGETVAFNASTSTPNGGVIVSYFWNFSDGTTSNVTSNTTTHAYLSFGNYTVMLTVKDSEGLANSLSKTITIIDYPIANFTYSPSYPIAGENVTFNASVSAPRGGTIVTYFWNFGDGSNSTGPIARHIYSTFGTYIVALEVIDSEQLANSTSMSINVRQHPTANFTCSPTLPMIGETITFDASLSEPNGGTIATYTWSFGDNQTGAGIIINHTYSTYGPLNVTLNVTDTEGLSNIFKQTIRIRINPVADFLYAPTYPAINQSVRFNASISRDPDGTIVAYTWNFDDGNITTLQDPSIQHLFSSENAYNITLTVTDNDGLNHTVTKHIIVYTTPTSVRDVAIISINPESPWVFQGQSLNIAVTITNQGTDLETFNVSLYYDGTEIGTFAVVNLFPNENSTVAFTWNTTNVYQTQYYITAVATVMPEETDIDDNTLSYGTISVLWMGDINHDGRVDMRDIAAIARGFGSRIGEPRYDPDCDLNKDGKIEMRDVAPAAKNFGKP